ncbi:MAG: monovalent cation/H(+) antiporter subunit G [Proteobacteria bacterium]|nr:monovalent cation/H(+) antiporter subunit G [Pseudomonadota bacterium]MBU1716712.1 monovalent cation/H(+) antiporter subunit G [Pseudomonadota bacterium]
MRILNDIGLLFIGIGMLFFISGTIGLLRFPDIYTRLHAMTKADNVGLGLLVLGLSCQADSWQTVARLIFIWILVLIASSASCHLVARSALQKNIQPWSRP